MSALAVAEPTAVAATAPAADLAATPAARPVPTRRGAGGRLRSSGGAPRLRAVPAPVAAADLADVGAAEPVTVTISIAAGGPVRRNRVLAALRELIDAAGPDTAIAGPQIDGLPTAPYAAGAPTAAGAAEQAGAAVVLDPLPRTVLLDGVPLELSRLEYDLLLFLAEHPRQVFSRTQLLAQVWGHAHTGARTIDVHVSRLRTKLGPESDVITTVYGLGYRLADDVPVAVVRR
jgi:two-component system response regulator MtrA